MKKYLFAGLGVMGFALASSAHAVQIVGSLSMSGGFTPDTGNLSTATAINFDPAAVNTGSFTVEQAFDDLAGFLGGSGTIKDFSINPFAPVDDFYTITVGPATLTFDLSDIDIELQNSNFLIISGLGTMDLTGFDSTIGTWNFTGQTAGGSTTAAFSWSASSGANPVPEPVSLALLGLGLAAFGFARRRRS